MTQPNPTNNESGNGGQQPNAQPTGNEPKSVEELPQWAQDEIKRARGEAANYRTRLRDAKQEVEAEVRQSVQKEVEELKTQVSDLSGKLANNDLNNIKLEAALQAFEIPGEKVMAFASRLNGSNADEIKADAEAVKSLLNINSNAGTRATDPTAGLGGADPKKTPESAFGEFVKGKLSR